MLHTLQAHIKRSVRKKSNFFNVLNLKCHKTTQLKRRAFLLHFNQFNGRTCVGSTRRGLSVTSGY